MIDLLLKSYFSILLSVGTSAILLLVLGLYGIVKLSLSANNPKAPLAKHTPVINSFEALPDISDISTIAGDDIIATQLDLARAYVETGKTKLAKKILESIVEQGSHAQQHEAKELLGLI